MADDFDDLHSPVTRPRSEQEEEEYQNAKLIRIESERNRRNEECVKTLSELEQQLETEQRITQLYYKEVKEQRTVLAEMSERLRIESHMRISHQYDIILALITGMLLQSCLSVMYNWL